MESGDIPFIQNGKKSEFVDVSTPQRLRPLRGFSMSLSAASYRILEYLEGAQWQTEATSELFENLVQRITVTSAEEVQFRLLNGLELTERLV